MEIERKFLVDRPPSDPSRFKHIAITQIYLTPIGSSTERRLRKVENSEGTIYFFTQKGGSGMIREESERAISREEYLSLRASAVSKELCKTRYFIPLERSFTAELDIYSGELAGLIVAEVEFGSSDDALNFTPPDWFGKEITNDQSYKNRALAEHGHKRNE